MTKRNSPQDNKARDEAGKKIERDDQIVPDATDAGNGEQRPQETRFLAALSLHSSGRGRQ